MRRLPLLCLAALIVVGCAADGEPAETPKPADGAPAVSLSEISTDPSPVGLFNGNATVLVGDSSEKAKTFRPILPTSYPLKDLPAKLPAELEVRGWEASEEGYGLILYQDKVVAAMYQSQNTTLDEVNDWVGQERRHMDKIPPVQLAGTGLQYWFWSDPKSKQTAMVCAQQKKRGFDLTVAMGDDSVLTILGASVLNARKLIYAPGTGAAVPAMR
jgi:hypothetical protein